MVFSYFLAHGIILILVVFNILTCCSPKWVDDDEIRLQAGVWSVGLYAAWLIVSALDFFNTYNVNVTIEAVK